MPQQKSAPPKKPLISGGLPRVPPAMTDDDYLRKAAADEYVARMKRAKYGDARDEAIASMPDVPPPPGWPPSSAPPPPTSPLPRGVGPGTDNSLGVPLPTGDLFKPPTDYTSVDQMRDRALEEEKLKAWNRAQGMDFELGDIRLPADKKKRK